jgi:hypothetical protein
MKSITIGIAGRARHGKGSVASALQYWCGTKRVESQIVSLADPIKDFLTQLLGRPEPFRGNDHQRNASIPEITWRDLSPVLNEKALQYYGPEAMTRNPSGRQLMQLFGSDVVRSNFMDDSWVRIAGSRGRNFQGISICDDVRFTNEARPRVHGGIFDVVLKVERPGMPASTHASEVAVDQIPLDWFSTVVPNDADLALLDVKVWSWAETFLLPHLEDHHASAHQ